MRETSAISDGQRHDSCFARVKRMDKKMKEKYGKNWLTPITLIQGFEDNNLYLKRDDLLPFSFGGNKIRIAQEFFLDMEAKKKTCMIGYGNARSNLSRAIANISASRGEDCHIISPADDNGTRIETYNSLIAKACEAHFHFCNKNEVADTVQAVIDECYAEGKIPYYIYGDKYGHGNEEVPLRAYVKVFREIQSQTYQMNVQFDYIFLATGTGMTQAGLIAGQAICGSEEKIVGISVARSKELQENILDTMLTMYSKKNDLHSIGRECIEVCDEYICSGYGQYNEEIVATIKQMMIFHGIPLDPTYTGKAFWGMLQYIKQKKIKEKNILFIHTGGMPLFFDNMELLKGV